MKLYYAPGACSLADHIALIETGERFDVEKVDLKAKRTESGADFTAINPKGYVPALGLEDGTVLTENIAVLSYLADRAGSLLPDNGMRRWRVLETTAFVSTEVHKNFKPFFSPDADDKRKAEARDILDKRFAYLNERLGDRDYIVEDEMSIADCYLFVTLRWAKEVAKISLPARLDAYYARLKERPSIRKAMETEGIA
ncbi:glutathione transferase GstA [Allosphingosinicella indica]|uniref:Glutathione S-transferase n=1 Tax=Allosphingosinicella indica TaxID=941907 RepID=A0A1X7GQ79_9SPHN|nr:glutathione transferase GstA [Allosphingosinicella indica]SMF72859.1 glutathione S-transferase [Allosphingosinicella indica]